MDCVLPDMDDLLDQLEASVAESAPLPTVASIRPAASSAHAIPRGRRSPSPSTCSSVSGAESDEDERVYVSSNGLGTPKAELKRSVVADVKIEADSSTPRAKHVVKVGIDENCEECRLKLTNSGASSVVIDSKLPEASSQKLPGIRFDSGVKLKAKVDSKLLESTVTPPKPFVKVGIDENCEECRLNAGNSTENHVFGSSQVNSDAELAEIRFQNPSDVGSDSNVPAALIPSAEEARTETEVDICISELEKSVPESMIAPTEVRIEEEVAVSADDEEAEIHAPSIDVEQHEVNSQSAANLQKSTSISSVDFHEVADCLENILPKICADSEANEASEVEPVVSLSFVKDSDQDDEDSSVVTEEDSARDVAMEPPVPEDDSENATDLEIQLPTSEIAPDGTVNEAAPPRDSDEHSSQEEDQKIAEIDELDDLERYLVENPDVEATEEEEVVVEEAEIEKSVPEPEQEVEIDLEKTVEVEKDEKTTEVVEDSIKEDENTAVEAEDVDSQGEEEVESVEIEVSKPEEEETEEIDNLKPEEEVVEDAESVEGAAEAPEDEEYTEANNSAPIAEVEFTEPEVVEIVEDENSQAPSQEDAETKRSVIASTHDISVETEGRLTESELQLGKVKPYWIPDEECTHCMLCETKFNVLNRRHHCRACGRVLCGRCCNNRRILAYMADANVKHRVCEPCVKTLEKIELYEVEVGTNEVNATSNEEENEVPAESAPGPSGLNTEAEQMPRTTKSALKVRKSIPGDEPCSSTAALEQSTDVPPRVQKRSVTFLDGVNPGDGGEELLPAEVVARAASASANKLKKKSARRALSAHRMREMRIEEEPICLFTGGSTVFVPKDDGTLEITDVSSVEEEIASGLPVVVALKRNLHVVVQLCELRCCNQGRVMCVSSRGLYGIGADEVVFVFELPEGVDVRLPADVLRKIDEIYMTCLDPQNATADEKVGIRMVRDRMLKLYRVDSGRMDGFDVTRILLFRPTHQCLEHLPLPSTPFYFACYIKRSEVIWSLAMPKRVLHKIGFHSSCFPAAVVNKWNREDVYFDQDYESSVLKVFTDFRNFSYRLTSVAGSTVSLADGAANIEIPTWAAEKLFSVINANRNMVAWAADIHPDADSILVCDQELHNFKTSIFAKVADQRSVTGCSFVIFDGALKSNTESMSVSIVEDGIVIRLRSTVMSDLVEKLLAGSDFEVNSKAMNLSIRWVKSAITEENPFTIRSPVDGFVLEEQWQYGALLTRQIRSLMPLQSATEWSLRLACVINVFEDKFPTTFQSKIFSICEEVAKLVGASLSPFISILVENNVRTIVMRIQLSQESAEYQTALWPGIDDIHAVWIVTLDDQVAPVLFNICSHVTSPFCAELHMPILSSRPLPEVPTVD